MTEYLRLLEKYWGKFVEDNVIDEKVKPYIAESWKRSKQYGIDPIRDRIGKQISENRFQKIIEENEELIVVARSIMEKLYNIVEGTNFLIMLTDNEGHILEIEGDKNILEMVKEEKFFKGSKWSEEVIGTNAISLSLLHDKPIQTVGAEHYPLSHHIATCSSSPIHGENGNVIGCLNMTGLCKDVNSHTLGIVAAGAYSIEKQLKIIRSNKLITTTFKIISEGMIITDENLKIKKVNKVASRILEMKKEEIYNLDIKYIMRDIDFKNLVNSKTSLQYIESSFYINNKKITCIASVTPMKINEKIIGIAIVFRESKTVNKLINKTVGNKATYTFNNIITKNTKMLSIIEAAKRVAKTNCTILIGGESGTGKELFAQSIHNESRCSEGPFIAVNCAALPRDLVESELFGYEKGAFTGALKEGNPGKFELAHGGTIFLDEIGELPLEIQSKLLRVLDSHKITRIGGKYEKELDVRVIAATNRNLYEEVQKKNFREDLYYRLNVISLRIIPLRDRPEDISTLASYFLEKLNRENIKKIKSISDDFIVHLERHTWNGNVREFQNVISRAYYLCEEEVITSKYLPENILQSNIEPTIKVIPVEVMEKKSIINAIINSKGNVMKAARDLNISKSTIYRKIKKYEIEVDRIVNK